MPVASAEQMEEWTLFQCQRVRYPFTLSPVHLPTVKIATKEELSIYKTSGKNFHEHEFSLNRHFIICFQTNDGWLSNGARIVNFDR